MTTKSISIRILPLNTTYKHHYTPKNNISSIKYSKKTFNQTKASFILQSWDFLEEETKIRNLVIQERAFSQIPLQLQLETCQTKPKVNLNQILIHQSKYHIKPFSRSLEKRRNKNTEDKWGRRKKFTYSMVI